MKTRAFAEQASTVLTADQIPALSRNKFTQATVDGLRKLVSPFKSSKEKKVSARLPEDLLTIVKSRLNVTTDTEAMQLALINMATADDFGSWLVGQTGSLTEDFTLDL